MPRHSVPIAFALLLAVAPVPSIAQPAPQMATPAPLDAAARREIVATLAQALRERYVFPDTGDRAAAAIEAALAAGSYDALSDPAGFAKQLTADLATVAHDKHLVVGSAMAGPPPRPAGGPNAMPAAESGVTRADHFAGNIGYIEVIGLPPPQVFKEALDRAMVALRGSRALIIDTRRNNGGTPGGVAYLVSYLIPANYPVEINTIVGRVPNTRDFTRTSFRSEPTPVSFSGVPTIVLTSKDTFSAGEGVAYYIQALKLGTIIGEVTGGGANPGGPMPIGHGMMIGMPTGRSESSVTKSNWEGRGVQPDIVSPADNALAVALKRLHQPPVRQVAEASLRQVFAPRTTPRPQSEPALRRLLDDLASGKIDDALVTPQAAQQMRRNLPMLQGVLARLGALQSVRFQHTDVEGGDFFELTFANGKARMALIVDAAGKVLAMQLPMQVPTTP